MYVFANEDKAEFLGADDPDPGRDPGKAVDVTIPATSSGGAKVTDGEIVIIVSGIWEPLVWRLACGVRSDSEVGTEFLESEVPCFSDLKVIGLGSSVVLKTEDGIGIVDGLETVASGGEVGCDLGTDVYGGRAGVLRGAGFVYTGSRY